MTRTALSILVASALLCAGCADPEQVRKHTYPPSFRYITQGEIRGTMSTLAVRIDELDQLMADDETVAPEDRERVVEILTEMQTLARDLNRATRTNHPRIDRYAPRLQSDIQRALISARSTRPSYYYAGSISGACAYCHTPPADTPQPPSPIPEESVRD